MEAVLALVAALAMVGAPSPQREPPKLRVLVVAGGHGYPQKEFREVFARYPDMACTFVEEAVGGEALEDVADWPYDAMVLYNYKKELTENQRDDFVRLMRKGVGLVTLHHAIYGYQSWSEWMKVVGVTSWLTGTRDGVDIGVRVADPKHPITKGLTDFVIHDETYIGAALAPKSRVILSTTEPSNSPALAWVHSYHRAKVCYLQLGHDEKAYGNDGFVTVLGRAIRWTAGRRISGTGTERAP